MNVIEPAELPPPGARVNTLTGMLPAEKTSAPETVAFNCAAPTKVVGKAMPFHCTTEQGTKELPVTASVNAAAPAGTVVGDSETILGAGRFVVGVVIVKATEFDVAPGLETETPAVPGNAASVARIEAVIWVELPKVVARGEPFQLTTDPELKFVPLTARVKPAGLQ